MTNSLLKKIAFCGILSTLALISFLIENLFPPLFFPGARMGVSNLFILIALIYLSPKYAYATVIIKTVIGSIFSGNPSAVLYSLPAGLISLTAEWLLLYYCKQVSIVAISVLGAVINICTQNIVFMLLTHTPEYLIYLPYLSLISIFSGLIVGLTTYLIIKKIPNKLNGLLN